MVFYLPDIYNVLPAGICAPIIGGYAITPSDSATFPTGVRGFLLTVGGNVKVTTIDGSTIVLPGLLPGVIYSMLVTKIWAASTTATGIFVFH